MRETKVEIYQSKVKPNGDWRWRLRNRNGEIQASGEGYKTYGGARRGVMAMLRSADAVYACVSFSPRGPVYHRIYRVKS